MNKTRIWILGLLITLVFSMAFTACDLGGSYAAPPEIITEPKNDKVILPYVQTSIKVNITVDAKSTDGGTLSYQWYSYKKKAEHTNQSGTAIAKGTKATLSVDLKKENKGANLYYVMVTNNKGDVKSKPVQSRGVTITLSLEDEAEFPVIVILYFAYHVKKHIRIYNIGVIFQFLNIFYCLSLNSY